jgi:hypothetical protein
MSDWTIEAIKQGGLFCWAAVATYACLVLFREYVKLSNSLMEISRADGASDAKMIGEISKLVQAVERADASRKSEKA